MTWSLWIEDSCWKKPNFHCSKLHSSQVNGKDPLITDIRDADPYFQHQTLTRHRGKRKQKNSAVPLKCIKTSKSPTPATWQCTTMHLVTAHSFPAYLFYSTKIRKIGAIGLGVPQTFTQVRSPFVHSGSMKIPCLRIQVQHWDLQMTLHLHPASCTKVCASQFAMDNNQSNLSVL